MLMGGIGGLIGKVINKKLKEFPTLKPNYWIRLQHDQCEFDKQKIVPKYR